MSLAECCDGQPSNAGDSSWKGGLSQHGTQILQTQPCKPALRPSDVRGPVMNSLLVEINNPSTASQ